MPTPVASRASDSITIFFMLRLRGFVSVEFGIGLHRRNNQLASLSASSMTYAARLLALRFVKPRFLIVATRCISSWALELLRCRPELELGDSLAVAPYLGVSAVHW